MSEWWSYRPSDFLLYSARTWWRLLEAQNLRWWPWHVAALVLALLAAGWALRTGRLRPLLVVAALASGFVAVAFHLGPHAEVNWAAPWYAAAWALQGALLLALVPRSRSAAAGVRRRGFATGLLAAAL